MANENDKVVEKLEIWKTRVFIAFLLIASIFGATALLILEFGVVANAWNLVWSGHGPALAESRSTTPSGVLRPVLPLLVIESSSPCESDGGFDPETMADVSPEVRFDAAMHELYGRIVRESGYTPSILYRMIHQYGGLETAHRLLKSDADPLSYDFQYLCKMRRADLTMEFLILSLDYKDRIFSEKELSTAGVRLAAGRPLAHSSER